MRSSVIQSVKDEKIIVIVRKVEREKILPLADALYAGGIRLMEITFDASGKTADTDTAENIRLLAESFRGRMHIGAGTVLTERQVELTALAGGSFIISPHVSREIIEKTVSVGLVSIPGALTPTEAQTAHLCGADFVKLFPITDLGVSYFKAIRAPLSHIPFLAVGGIDLTNISAYLAAGASGFGIGGNIIDKKRIAENRFGEITALAEQYTKAVKG